MRILVTGGSGALGKQLLPMLERDGHEVRAPGHAELDLYDPEALATALAGVEAVYHLATRIPTGEKAEQPSAWDENNRLRIEASRLLADAGLAAEVGTFVYPSISFIYPEGPADETSTPAPATPNMSSTLVAEKEAARFGQADRRWVVLRLGLLYGPGSGSEVPNPIYGSTVSTTAAARALLAALEIPSGVYNVVDDGGQVSNALIKRAAGWTPEG